MLSFPDALTSQSFSLPIDLKPMYIANVSVRVRPESWDESKKDEFDNKTDNKKFLSSRSEFHCSCIIKLLYHSFLQSPGACFKENKVNFTIW